MMFKSTFDKQVFLLRGKFPLLLLLIVTMVMLTGCPYSTFRQLDEQPQFPTQPIFLGVWNGTSINESSGKRTAVELHISGQDEFHYGLKFIGFFGKVDRKKRPLLDTVQATAFMSQVDQRNILNIKSDGRTFLVVFEYDEKDQISLLPLAEQFTSFFIQNNADLRKAVSNHFKTRLFPAFDETFCLRNMRRVSQSIPQ
jgi:hypothetical protein